VEDKTIETSRRGVLGAATLGGLMLAAFAGKASAEDWTPAEQANVKLVNDFLAAAAPKDMGPQLAFLADDVSYRMTENSPVDRGHDAMVARLKSYVDNATAVELKVLSTFAAGPIVINHRIDKFTSPTNPLLFEGVGVFFIQRGKIKEWTDYTIKVG